MKRISFLLFFSCATLLSASAQKVNFQVGGGLASHYGGSTRNIGAFKAGVSYEHELSGNFSIEPGVFFYAKGYKDKNEEVIMRDDEGNVVIDDNGEVLTGVKNVTTSAYYVEVPVLANYYIELSQLHYIELSAGPYAAVGVGGKRKTRGDTDQEAAKRYYYEKNTFSEDGVHRFDFGIEAGVSYEFNRSFAVGAQADFGLINFHKDGAKNISAVLTFTYKLGLN